MPFDSVHFSLFILGYRCAYGHNVGAWEGWMYARHNVGAGEGWMYARHNVGAGEGWMCISLSEGAGKGGLGRVDWKSVSKLSKKTEKGMLLKSYDRNNEKCF